MEDFAGGGVEDEAAAEQDNEAVEVEAGIDHTGPIEAGEGVFEQGKYLQQGEEQDEAQDDGQTDAPVAYALLIGGWGTFRLERNVQEVIESKHGLEHDEHEQGEDDFHGGPFVIRRPTVTR